jgi:hypothetical protein
MKYMHKLLMASTVLKETKSAKTAGFPRLLERKLMRCPSPKMAKVSPARESIPFSTCSK